VKALVVALTLFVSVNVPAQSISQLFGEHEPLVGWHKARAAELGHEGEQVTDALLGEGGRLKILVNPLLAGEGDAPSLAREAFERPGGSPLSDATVDILGRRVAGDAATLHSVLQAELQSAFGLLLKNRVDSHRSLSDCIDESANDQGAVIVLAADAVLEGGADDPEDELVVHLELRLLRVAVDAFAAGDDQVMPVTAVELLWADRHAGRAPLDGSDEKAVLDAFEEAVLDALSSGLVPNLWGDPELLEVDWFRQREGVLGQTVHDDGEVAVEEDV
jgi:hypothetical protein